MSIVPLRALIFLVALQLGISLGFMNYFCRTFGFGRSLLLLHLSIVAGLVTLTTLGPGFLLLVRPVRAWRLTRFVLALIPAAAFVALMALYVADFAATALWEDTINYRLVSQHLLRWDVVYAGPLSLSPWVYVALVGGAACIVVTFLALSGATMQGLAELLVPGRPWSLFRDRRRAVKSGVILALACLGYAGYILVLAHGLPSGGIASAEPILSFFCATNTLGHAATGAFLRQGARITELEQQARHVRAHYPAGQAFDRKNVVIIIVDSLRADRMQIYGYERPTTPFLAELLESGRLRKVEFAEHPDLEAARKPDPRERQDLRLAPRSGVRDLPDPVGKPRLVRTEGGIRHGPHALSRGRVFASVCLRRRSRPLRGARAGADLSRNSGVLLFPPHVGSSLGDEARALSAIQPLPGEARLAGGLQRRI